MGQKSSKKNANISSVMTSTRTEALDRLPEDLVWHCRKAISEKKGKWEFDGNEEVGYMWKEFQKGSDDYSKAQNVFNLLGGESLPVKSIYGVYNPMLMAEFANNRQMMEDKKEENSWNQDWREDDQDGLRAKIEEEYKRKTNVFSWNKDLDVPVIPAAHGTGFSIAKAISKTGFAAISSLDSGFFGKGIYFTTSSKYALPYATLQPDPVIIISYIVPGNIYPTSEQHKGPKSLAGKPLRTPGYNSHYVLTRTDGFALSDPSESPFYDEIVLPDESQVVPAFIIALETGEELKKQQSLFERELVDA